MPAFVLAAVTRTRMLLLQKPKAALRPQGFVSAHGSALGALSPQLCLPLCTIYSQVPHYSKEGLDTGKELKTLTYKVTKKNGSVQGCPHAHVLKV